MQTIFDDPSVKKMVGLYEEYRTFMQNYQASLQEMAVEMQRINQQFLEKYNQNMKEFMEKVTPGANTK